jgi:hypothetical protein
VVLLVLKRQVYQALPKQLVVVIPKYPVMTKKVVIQPVKEQDHPLAVIPSQVMMTKKIKLLLLLQVNNFVR